MLFIRAIARGLLLLVIIVSLSLWLIAVTMQTTVLNRQATKSWVAESGVYDKVVSNLLKVEQAESEAQGIVSAQILQKAMDQTFPADYVQQNSEMALDASYDWLGGKKPKIEFAIATDQKREDFTSNLETLLAEKLANYPTCPISFKIAGGGCIPEGFTAQTYARAVATQTADSSTLFEAPLTQDSFIKQPSQANIPSLANYSNLANFVLPPVIILAAGAYVLLSGSKLKGLAVVSRRIFFIGFIPLLLGVVGMYFGSTLQLGGAELNQTDPQKASFVTEIVEPIVRTVVPAVSLWLTIFSSIIVLIGGGIWLMAYLIRRKKAKSIASASLSVPMGPQHAPEAPPRPKNPPSNKPPTLPTI